VVARSKAVVNQLVRLKAVVNQLQHCQPNASKHHRQEFQIDLHENQREADARLQLWWK
jgi:hypothetical protein